MISTNSVSHLHNYKAENYKAKYAESVYLLRHGDKEDT